MNKYELAKKINELEGLTNDEKSELIKLLRSQKKYGLVWEDKPEDAEQRMVNEQPVLVEVPERAILSDDAEAPNHILIEGDNLEALTALSYTYAGKIDVIYIDPPYNTGNKDFTYNDTYVDKEDGFRHSKWLSFMNKRLKIAKGKSRLKFCYEYDLDAGNLSRIENGIIDPKLSMLWRLSEAIDVPLSEIFRTLEQKLGKNFTLLDK